MTLHFWWQVYCLSCAAREGNCLERLAIRKMNEIHNRPR